MPTESQRPVRCGRRRVGAGLWYCRYGDVTATLEQTYERCGDTCPWQEALRRLSSELRAKGKVTTHLQWMEGRTMDVQSAPSQHSPRVSWEYLYLLWDDGRARAERAD